MKIQQHSGLEAQKLKGKSLVILQRQETPLKINIFQWVRKKTSPQKMRYLREQPQVWNIPERKDLDPVRALEAYDSRRNNTFGKAENLPFFLHENGSIYSKLELNQDLAELLATFPELNSSRDKWSGHSFRAGLTTILSLLGFSKEEIQKWGRWKSEAYLFYIKDMTQRRNVRAKLTQTFQSILSYV